MLSILSRTAYSTFLHTSYEIPLFVLFMSAAIDILSLFAPLRLLLSPDDTSKTPPTARLEIIKEPSLSIVLTLIVSSIMSIAIYVAQKTSGASFLMGHFDQIRSIRASPLPLLVLAYLPAGYCLQEVIYKHGFHHGTIASLVSAFVVGSAKIGMGVRGGDLLGVFGVVQYWNAAMAVASLVIGYILQV